jgi:hypothetical protein
MSFSGNTQLQQGRVVRIYDDEWIERLKLRFERCDGAGQLGTHGVHAARTAMEGPRASALACAVATSPA